MSWMGWLTKVWELCRKGQTVELKHDLMNAQEENQRLKGQVRELEREITLGAKLEFGDGMYWLEREDSEEREGPFCQVCNDGDNKLIHLQEHGEQWECLVCENVYPLPDEDEEDEEDEEDKEDEEEEEEDFTY